MITAYTSICEEDAYWIPQYLAEIERLCIPFAIHFDRCTVETKRKLEHHRYCIGKTEQNLPMKWFNEMHKQGIFDTVQKSGVSWAVAWDIDETWEKDAPAKLRLVEQSTADYITCKWVNLWNDPQHIRIDGSFGQGHRVKFYNLRSGRWYFDNAITNGAKLLDAKGEVIVEEFTGQKIKLERLDLVCLHWGMMTLQLRIEHKDRWDRIYGRAVGTNPYGFWDMALNEVDYPPKIEENPYL